MDRVVRMPEDDLSRFIAAFPKVDIHYHMVSGTRVQTMCDIAHENGIALSLDEARSYYRSNRPGSGPVKGAIQALHFLYRILNKPRHYQRLLREIAEDAGAVGVRYLELFWNPNDVPMAYAEVDRAMGDAIADIEARTHLMIRLIPAINREKAPSEAERMVGWVLENPSPHVVGIGIDYHEEKGPIENFSKAYERARAGGLHLTGHCGEFGLSWKNVESGLRNVGLERIDHGYTVIDDDALCAECVQRHIPFTVVPHNTFYLRKWPDHETWRMSHPLRRMAAKGLVLVPATDDWHVHNTNAAKVYRSLVEDFEFDLDGIRQCMVNGINACWAPESAKQRWLMEWPQTFDRLRSELNVEDRYASGHPVHYRLT